MKWILSLLVLLPATVAAGPVSAVGTWTGKLGENEGLRIVFHLEKGEDGSITGTMDSPDQGANGIPVSSVAVDGEQWTIRVDRIGGTFEGTENGDTISGTWSQGPGTLPLALVRSGDTLKGRIKIPSPKLTIVFRIEKDGDRYTAKLDSPDQGATGIPVDSVSLDHDQLELVIRALKGRYAGTIDHKDTMTGTWSQGGVNFPLTMTRQK